MNYRLCSNAIHNLSSFLIGVLIEDIMVIVLKIEEKIISYIILFVNATVKTLNVNCLNKFLFYCQVKSM